MSIVSTGLDHDETPRAGRLTYTIDEAAALLGVGRNLAYEEAAKTGRIANVAVIKVGKRLLISRAALDRILDGSATA